MISFDIVLKGVCGIEIDSFWFTSIFTASEELSPQLKLRESPKIIVGFDKTEFVVENSTIILERESHKNGVWNCNLFSPLVRLMFEWKTSVNPLKCGVVEFNTLSLVCFNLILKKLALLLVKLFNESPKMESLLNPKFVSSSARYKNCDLLDALSVWITKSSELFLFPVFVVSSEIIVFIVVFCW